MSLNIRKFFKISTQLAFEACRIIKDVHQSNSLNKIMKGHNDPVTEADYRVQSMIIEGLRSYWPTLRIVGEQSGNLYGSPLYSLLEISKSFQGAFPGLQLLSAQEIPLEESCVWVDPLDATLSYTKGELDEVTTLIGLSHKKRARLGVIGMPYRRQILGYAYDPKVLIGDAAHPGVYEVSPDLSMKEIPPRKSKEDFRVVITKNNVTQQQAKLIQGLSKDIAQVGGSGKKIAMVVKGQADTLIYLGARTSMWDVCAGDAIVKASGGCLTTTDGEQMTYDPEATNYVNRGGIACSIDLMLQQKVLKTTQGYK